MSPRQICKSLNLLRRPAIELSQILGLYLVNGDLLLLLLLLYLTLEGVIRRSRLRRILAMPCIVRLITSAGWLPKLRELSWLRLSNVWILRCFCIWVVFFRYIRSRLVGLSVCSCTVVVRSTTSFIAQGNCRWETCFKVKMRGLVYFLRFC